MCARVRACVRTCEIGMRTYVTARSGSLYVCVMYEAGVCARVADVPVQALI